MRRDRETVGIDVGSTRVRLVRAHERASGAAILAVITRDLPQVTPQAQHGPDSTILLLREIIAEAGLVKPTCVLAIDEPYASLRRFDLPRMSRRERERAALFEARRYLSFAPEETIIRMAPLDGNDRAYVLGTAVRKRLSAQVDLVREAGARPIAVDHAMFAVRRAFPDHQTIVDIGFSRTTVYVYGSMPPFAHSIAGGSSEVTNALQLSLEIDAPSAERRKRTIGMAGAAESAVRDLVQECGETISQAKSRLQGASGRVALMGNGARVPGILEQFREELQLPVDLAPLPTIVESPYPVDVLRATFADWALAYGLTKWSPAKDDS